MPESPSMPEQDNSQQLIEWIEELRRENAELRQQVQSLMGSAATEQVVEPPAEPQRRPTFGGRLRNNWRLHPGVALTMLPLMLGGRGRGERRFWQRRREPLHTETEPTVSRVVREGTTSPAASTSEHPQFIDDAFVASAPTVGGGGVLTEEVHRREQSRNGRWASMRNELRVGWQPVARDIGVLAVAATGIALTYIAIRNGGMIPGIPEWARNDPNLYNELMNYPGIDVPTVGEIIPNPDNIDLFRDIKEADPNMTGDGLDNVFQDTALYRELQEITALTDDEIHAFFKDDALHRTVTNLGLTVEEIGRVIDNRTNFEALLANNFLSPEAAAEAMQYPEIVEAIRQNGADASIIQAIDNNERVFIGLAEMDAPYAVIQDVLTHPEGFDEVMTRLEDPNTTTNDLLRPAPSGAYASPDVDVTSVWLGSGEGATNALQSLVEGSGRALSGDEYWELHQQLVREHGTDYLRGIETYSMGGTVFDFGYADQGYLTTEPGVYEDVLAYADQH